MHQPKEAPRDHDLDIRFESVIFSRYKVASDSILRSQCPKPQT